MNYLLIFLKIVTGLLYFAIWWMATDDIRNIVYLLTFIMIGAILIETNVIEYYDEVSFPEYTKKIRRSDRPLNMEQHTRPYNYDHFGTHHQYRVSNQFPNQSNQTPVSFDSEMNYLYPSRQELIQSNLGISHTTPLTDDMQMRTRLPETKRNYTPISLDQTYDPRSFGYGNNDRYHLDPLKRPSYFYSDIDSIRRPDYVVRSNVDHNPFGNNPRPHYGSLSQPAPTYSFHDMDKDFISHTNFHRSNLQESLLRKRNSEMYQLRAAPIRTL